MTAQKTWTDLMGKFNSYAVVADCGSYWVISKPVGNSWRVLWTFENESQAKACYEAWKNGN